jgi:hypothetical protein
MCDHAHDVLFQLRQLQGPDMPDGFMVAGCYVAAIPWCCRTADSTCALLLLLLLLLLSGRLAKEIGATISSHQRGSYNKCWLRSCQASDIMPTCVCIAMRPTAAFNCPRHKSCTRVCVRLPSRDVAAEKSRWRQLYQQAKSLAPMALCHL